MRMPDQIHCLECGGDTPMIRKRGTPAVARYECAQGHVRLLPKNPQESQPIRHIPVRRGPNDAA